MSKASSNQNVNSSTHKANLKKKVKRQRAIERAMESLESRMLLSVSGFQPAVNYKAGVGPSAVAKGDFNGDGKLDLVVANQTSNNVSVLFGNGNGTFGAATNFAAGNGPQAVVVGDFNGDGKLDIAVADAAGNNISVLLNNGSGGFNSLVAYNVGVNPVAIVAGDFTGNGKIDLAVTNYHDNTITVLAGNGNGTFGSPQTLSAGGIGPNAIAAADFNGDHKIDLAVTDDGGGVSVLLSNGIGGFGAAHVFAAGITPTGLVTGLFNGDSNVDLAIVNATGDNVSVLLGAGDGTFGTATNYGVASGPLAISAGDFNNDSKMDLAIVNAISGNVSILSGHGDGSFSAATNKSVGTNPQAVVAGDFNGDGSSDLAVVNQDSDNVSVLLDKHITTVGIAQDIHEGEALAGVTVATFTDSEAGTVVGDYTASINWGDGTSASAETITFGGGHFSVAGSHTYGEKGVYTVTATVQDTLGTTSQSTAVAIVRDAALTSSGVVIAVDEGASFNNTVASFNDANIAAPPSDFTAAIQWGDGTSTNGTIVSDGGGAFHVNAAHVWQHKSVPIVTVVIRDIDGSKTTATYTATISDAPLTPAAGTPVFTEGSSATQTITNFTDANPFGSAAEFSAIIHWGDGSSDSAGTVSSNGAGGYKVQGTHSYVHSGNKSASVSITSVDGQTASQNVTVAVHNAALTATSPGGQFTEAIPFSGAPVAFFTDANAGATAGDFTATIDWGDGTAFDHGTTIVVNTGNPGFIVKGDHNYLHGGHPAVSVTILGAGGGTANPTSTAEVLNRTLSAYGPFQAVVNYTTSGNLYRGISGAFNTNNNAYVGVISATGGNVVTYMAGNGNGTFASPTDLTIGHGSQTVAAGDFNGDGKLDLVTVNDNNTISVALGNGDGTFAAANNINIGALVTDVAVGDFNGDGKIDIMAVTPSTTNVRLLAGDGTGAFSASSVSSAGQHPSALTAVDLNGDGVLDLAVISKIDGTVARMINNGSGSFSITGTYSVGSQPVSVKVADLNGDGKLDLVVSNSGDNTVSVLTNDGAGGYNAATYSTGLGTQDLAVVDLYNTGKPDILVADEGDGTVSILLNKGDGTFAPQMAMPANHGTLGLVIGDFNGDGKSDLVANSFNTGIASAFINNGAVVAAVEGTAFSSNTVLMHFTDPNGSAVAADFPTVSINWGDSSTSSGVVVANINGGFDVIGGHNYSHAGNKTIVTTVTGAGGGVVTGATKVHIANAALSLAGNAIAPTEGISFSGKVAHFTDANAAAIAADFTASIVWGDGNTTTGTVVAAQGGGFDVNGIHLYAEEGTQTVSVTITGLGGGTANDSNTATIADAALSPTGADISGTEGTSLAGVKVASFTDADPAGTVADYTALIHWGDNSTSAGTITANGSGGFDVTGTHTYNHAGDHAVSVDIADVGGATPSATSSNATVDNATIAVTVGSFTSTEGISASQSIATFTDSNTAASPGDFTATVTWGDGATDNTTTNAVIITGSNGNYAIIGTHQYNHAGTALIGVTLNGAYHQVGSTSLTATVHNAVITPINGTFTATEGASFSGVVGHFSDANSAAIAADFSASINWGDGTTTNTVLSDITADGSGGFYVHGTHTYAEEGAASVATTITGLGGDHVLSTYTSTVADAELTATGINLTAIEGTGFTSKIVANFTDADPSGATGDFTANINWGDGHSTAGTVTADGHGGWNVSGDYLYAVASQYVVTTTVTDSGGATKAATGVSAVAHGTISATAVDITAVEGNALPGGTLVAHFTDTNLSAIAGNFTATIDWGDSSSASNATVTSDGSGGFDVKSGHTYNHAGTNHIVVSISGVGDSKTASATATVNNNAINITGKVNTAVEGTAFIGNIVGFADANGAAIKGDFTATIDWNDGSAPTTGTINDANGGGFNVAGTHTYTSPATYNPTVTITGRTSQTFTGSGVVAVADATLDPSTVTIHAVEGTSFSGIVGSFQDQNHGSVVGNFSATINWGDSHVDAATLTSTGNGAFTISGTHTWATAGVQNVVVSIQDTGGSHANITSTAFVGDATLTATGQAVTAIEGVPLSGALVNTFSDANPLAVASDFTATITWGDGSGTSAGTVTRNVNTGLFEVTGNHTYAHAGSKIISISINDVGGATTGSVSTATIANAVLGITAGTATGVEGQQIVANVASFTDANQSASATDFTALINWGDNATSVGAISVGVDGGFDVLGAHVFTHAGSHTVTVTINGNGGGTVNATLTAAISNATLAGTGKTATVVENQSLNTVLANFIDANTHASATDFSATINWNDGSALDSNTTVTANINGGFNVTGTHTYLHSGDKAPVVTLHGLGGGSAQASATVHVNNDTIVATGVANLTTTEGVLFSNTLVAHFTVANPNAAAGDFTATIDWGDSLPLDTHTHIVANINGGFDVLGDHMYAHAGNRTISLTVNGNGGGVAHTTVSASVLNAAMNSTGATLNSTEGLALGSSIIAHFTDANAAASAGDFTASIHWGDDSVPATGTIAANVNGGFDVTSNHTYNHAGDKTYTVTIQGLGGGITSPTGTVHVANAALTPSAAAFTATEGISFSEQVVGHFVDANLSAFAADFTATVLWGDGSEVDTNTTIVANASGGFDVVAGHTYTHAGEKTLGVQITGTGGATVSTPNTAHVNNGVLIPTGYPVTAIEGAAYTGIVAHFTDANLAAITGDFTAVIDWGDQTTSVGTLSANNNGGFDVTGTHTYNPQGTRTITTTITGQGSGQAVALSTMVVQDALLDATGKTVAGIVNVSLNNVLIASFVDANPLDDASHFTATITWENGSTFAGAIVKTSTGHYNVTGSHTYTTTGSKTAGVLIQDAGGSLQTVNATVNVSGPGLNANFIPFTATEGTGLTGKVSHFATSRAGATAGGFAASIDWADGTTSAGTIVANAAGGFDVTGSHTWRVGGYKAVSVRITDVASSGYIIAGGNNYVGVKRLSATGVSLRGTALVNLAATVANFTSANALAIASDFTATIVWGDGTSSLGTVVAKAGGGYSVLASHTFAAKGTLTARVYITSISGATTVATSRISVGRGVASNGPKVGGSHGGPPPTTHGGNPGIKKVKFGAWEKPQQLEHGI